MLINHIHIKDICVARELDITPGAVTIFKGRNGSGKSAAIKAIRSCLNKGDFAHLLADGATEGETVLTFDDGMTVRRALTPGKSTLSVHQGALKGSWSVIEEAVDKVAVNAEAFMYVNDEKKFTQLLLESMPLVLDEATLREALPGYLIPKGHALEVLDTLRKQIYDERTAVNRVAKDKESAARERRAKIGDVRVEDDLAAQLEAAETEYEEAVRADSQGRAAIEKKYSDEVTRLRENRDRAIAEKSTDIRKQIRALEQELADFERAEANHCQLNEDWNTDACRKELEQFGASHTEALGALRDTLATLRERVQNQAVIRVAIEDAERDEAAAKLAKDQSEHLTSQIETIDQLKVDLLKDLPIRGVTVESGVVLIDGKKIGEIPDSRRAEFTVDIAIARADMAGWPIVVVDGLDKLDDTRFEHLKHYLQACGRQIFCARWSTGEFEVETLPAAEAEA